MGEDVWNFGTFFDDVNSALVHLNVTSATKELKWILVHFKSFKFKVKQPSVARGYKNE